MTLLIDQPITLEVAGKIVTMTAREAAKVSIMMGGEKFVDLTSADGQRFYAEYVRRRDLSRWRSIELEAPEAGQEIEYRSNNVITRETFGDGLLAAGWLWRPVQR